MKSFITIYLSLLVITLSAQQIKSPTYIKFSAGRVSFGTGDYLGPSASFEISKPIAKNKLQIGTEFLFENGVNSPVIINPTIEEFFGTTFGHATNYILWPKIAYYPFKKIISGFNIHVGPTVGYSYHSQEKTASRVVDPNGDSRRISTLTFDNSWFVGYRISTGYEFSIKNKFITGFRLDFSNNNREDINTLLGLKFGMKF